MKARPAQPFHSSTSSTAPVPAPYPAGGLMKIKPSQSPSLPGLFHRHPIIVHSAPPSVFHALLSGHFPRPSTCLPAPSFSSVQLSTTRLSFVVESVKINAAVDP